MIPERKRKITSTIILNQRFVFRFHFFVAHTTQSNHPRCISTTSGGNTIEKSCERIWVVCTYYSSFNTVVGLSLEALIDK